MVLWGQMVLKENQVCQVATVSADCLAQLETKESQEYKDYLVYLARKETEGTRVMLDLREPKGPEDNQEKMDHLDLQEYLVSWDREDFLDRVGSMAYQDHQESPVLKGGQVSRGMRGRQDHLDHPV